MEQGWILCNLLAHKSRKIPRKVISTFGAETHSGILGVDAGSYLRDVWEQIEGRQYRPEKNPETLERSWFWKRETGLVGLKSTSLSFLILPLFAAT